MSKSADLDSVILFFLGSLMLKNVGHTSGNFNHYTSPSLPLPQT